MGETVMTKPLSDRLEDELMYRLYLMKSSDAMLPSSHAFGPKPKPKDRSKVKAARKQNRKRKKK